MLSHHHSLFNPFTHMLSHFIIQPHPCTLHDGSHILSLAPPINKHPLQPQNGFIHTSHHLPKKAVHHTSTPTTSIAPLQPLPIPPKHYPTITHPFLHTITTPKPVVRPCATTKRRRRGPKRSYNSSLSCWNF
ncbi:S2-RNase [Pyrus ussuriensis x Pyrus communis]|uniref:S2-RNase n=1 Tax=Pyrus ussuriensis x Pyrus communis TaxID=2448454 RepID=A0A5N5I639_9ROSA|nr:S2-RNase [Pyrus ussuriensis x Pyrus communis]